MKKSLLSVFAMATMLLATGCSQEEELVNGGENGELVEVSFNLKSSEGPQSRALSDGKKAKELYWTVFNQDGEVIPQDEWTKTMNEDPTVGTTVTFTLVKGQTYDFVFWAQTPNTKYYNITEKNLKEITVNYNSDANDESRDAFFGNVLDYTVEGKFTKTVYLTRPFGQLNVGTTKDDYEKATTLLLNKPVNHSKLVVVKNLPNKLNLLTGEASVTEEAKDKEAVFSLAELPVDTDAEGDYEILYVDTDKNEETPDEQFVHLSMNYLLASNTPVLHEVNITLANGENDENIINTINVPNVPIQRNYRTNILGQILTTEGDFTIIVDEEFEKPDNIYNIEDKENALIVAAANGGEVTLTEDVNMTKDDNEPAERPYLEAYADFTLNINEGVTFTSGSADDYGLIVKDGTTTINGDGNFTSNGGGIAVADGAEVIFNGGKLYVDTPSTSGRYLFYLVGEGSTATINGGNFSWDKADNQKRAYIYANAGTTVYVKGGTFGKASTRSGYTAGILGEGTVIITGGTFGFDPSNWVAEGYKAVKDGNDYIVLPEIVADLYNVTEATTVSLDNDVTVSSGTTIQTQNATADITINGNGKTIVSTATSADAFQWEGGTIPAMSTILSSANGEKVTVNDLNFTGTMSALMLGNYVDGNSNWFNTELNNVNVIDAEVVSFSANVAPAVCVYGTATLNNCNIHGTTLSPLDTDPMWPVYDLVAVNYSKTTLNECIIGTCYIWNQAELIVGDKTELEKLIVRGNMNTTKYGVTIKAGAKVGAIDLSAITNKTKINFTIEDGATVGKIVANGAKYASIAEWQAAQ